VNLVVGAQQGALLEQLVLSRTPVKRRRQGPARSVPPAFADSLDRDGEGRYFLQSK